MITLSRLKSKLRISAATNGLVLWPVPSKDQMQSENLIKCAHEPCRCLVEVEDQFCSPVCAKSDGAAAGPCPCGHPECVGAEEAADEADLETTETS